MIYVLSHKHARSLFAIGTVWIGLCMGLTAWASDYYVSPQGDDEQAGTIEAPFATLARAQQAIRADRANGAGVLPSVVWLANGDYELTSTLQLTEEDSDTSYRALPGHTPRLLGGRRINPSAFTLVTSASPVWHRLATSAKGQLYQADLGALGLTDYGTLKDRGISAVPVAAMELYVNERPMTLGRWPNRGSFEYVATAIDTTHFTYSGTAPSRWTEAPDPWVHGYFFHLWADYAREASIDTATKTITLGAPMSLGIAKGRPWFAFNLLEEIDIPGEYYIDRANGLLYYWPIAPLASSDIVVSLMETPLIRISGAARVELNGLTLFAARGNLLNIDSGSDNRVVFCRLLGPGTVAAQINGTRNGLERCEVAYSGGTGVNLAGGDRPTLTPGANYLRTSRVHDFGRLTLTYQGAVFIQGVGNVVEHNHFHDGDHTAVRFNGNDHLLSNNRIHDVLKWTEDAGVIYTGRDWSTRGIRIRHNFIYNINSGFSKFVQAIYLDDAASGFEIYGNVIYKVGGNAMFNGAGHKNRWENNIVAWCDTFHRGDDRYGTLVTNGGTSNSWDLLYKLNQLPWKGPVWSNAYPDLAAIPNNYVDVKPWYFPKDTTVMRNVSWQNKKEYYDSWTYSYYHPRTNNLTGINPQFVDVAGLDFSLKPTSPALAIPGFEPIPFYDIGLHPLWIGKVSTNWNDPNNWAPPFVPDETETAEFGQEEAAVRAEAAIPSNLTVRRLLFSGADASVIGNLSAARRLTIGPGGIQTLAGTHVIRGEKSLDAEAYELVLSSDTEFAVAEGAELILDARIHHGSASTRHHTKTGGGTLTINAQNGVMDGASNQAGGSFEVLEGTLLVNGTLSTGSVRVAAEAVLGGAGTINGPTTVAAGATLAPGNPAGRLTFGYGLTVQPGAQMRFRVGTEACDVVVTGALVLAGTLTVEDAEALTSGAYTLFTYNDTFTDQGLTLVNVPTNGLIYRIDQATDNQVRLIVRTPFEQWAYDTFDDPESPQAQPNYFDPQKRLTTFQQFLAGLDPARPDSQLAVIYDTPPSGEGIAVRWQSVGGKRYRIQYCDDLICGTFTTLTRSEEEETDPNPPGTEGSMVFIDDFSETGVPPGKIRLYRIQLVVPDAPY